MNPFSFFTVGDLWSLWCHFWGIMGPISGLMWISCVHGESCPRSNCPTHQAGDISA